MGRGAHEADSRFRGLLSLSAVRFPHPLPRDCVGLLGPCFKTGRMVTFAAATSSPPDRGEPSVSATVGANPVSRSQPPVLPRPAVPKRVPGNATDNHTLFLLTISSTFYSLSKVLFIFPSRYLFAIGIPAVFSLGWNLPPILGLHSQATRLHDSAS